MTDARSTNDVHHATLVSLMLASGSALATSSAHVDLDDPTSASNRYLQSLTSKSLSDLRGQPASLSEARNSLNTQLSSLCTQYVSSFVQVHQATSSLPTSLATLDTVLDSIVNRHLPALSTSSQQFSSKVESSLQAKQNAHILISQYELSLKDLMDIPKLLMTCVRANHPVEALLLAVHMMKFERRGKFAGTIKSLQDECWVHLRRLQDDLLRALGARGLRLPAAKRIVSLLRKFKEVDEAQRDHAERRRVSMSDSSICISFLCSRWALLEESTSNSSSSKSSAILSAQLSTWRDIVGDTCGMSQTLFPPGNSSEEDELSPTTLIASFSRQAISILQELLSESIPGLPEDSINLRDTLETLAALHTQLCYSAASLSRQGLDISRVASGHSIFHRQVVEMWTRAMRDSKLELSKARRGKRASNSLTWVDKEKADKLLREPLNSLKLPIRLGEVLKLIPDLRLFANHILDSYNALLYFAPLQAGRGVAGALDDALFEVCSQLFDEMKNDEVIDIDLSLDPIVSTKAGSRYYEKDTTRLSQANVALLARVMCTLCGPIATHLRALVSELFGEGTWQRGADGPLDHLFFEIIQWCESSEQTWLDGERLRRERVKKEEEKLAAEELKKEEEEAERLAEMERMRIEEVKKREAEEAERRIMIEKERAEEEERLRTKEVEERRREAEEQETQERIHAEETRQKLEEEEEATKILQAAEAKKKEDTAAKEGEKDLRLERVLEEEKAEEKRKEEEERKKQLAETESSKLPQEQAEERAVDKDLVRGEESVLSTEALPTKGKDGREETSVEIASAAAQDAASPKMTELPMNPPIDVVPPEGPALTDAGIEAQPDQASIIAAASAETPNEYAATSASAAEGNPPISAEQESGLARKGSTATNKLAEKLRQRQEQRQKKVGGASAQAEGT